MRLQVVCAELNFVSQRYPQIRRLKMSIIIHSCAILNVGVKTESIHVSFPLIMGMTKQIAPSIRKNSVREVLPQT